MLSTGKAAKKIGIHPQTLRRWEKSGKIQSHRTKQNQRRYRVEDVNKLVKTKSDKRKKYIYCRVSSKKQIEDLNRQVKYMQAKYPEFETITDISSGIHFNRQGFKKILEQILQGNVSTIAVAYKDRLSRFNFDIIKYIAKFYNTKIIIDFNRSYEPHKEIAEDIISIITSFSAKIHGSRKYKNHKSKNHSIKNA